MTKKNRPLQLNATHLQRMPIVYLRQSTRRQADENTGSLAHQGGQREYLRQLGWPVSCLGVSDADQGRNGAATEPRTGRMRLLTLPSEGKTRKPGRASRPRPTRGR